MTPTDPVAPLLGEGPPGTSTARLPRIPAWPLLASAVLIAGCLLFAQAQTQEIFRGSFRFQGLFSGAGRHDGNIFAAALLANVGLGLLVASLSPLPRRARIGPAALMAACTTIVSVLHLTIFVNSLTIAQTGQARLRASLMFHDGADFLPEALWVLTMLTFALLLVAALATMRLVVPHVLERHFARPTTTDAHRTRLLLTSLFLVANLTFGAKTFLGYALLGDAAPTGGFLNTNLVLVYYLLAICLMGAILMHGWRTARLLWGNLRDKRTMSFRRSLVPVRQSETWILGVFGVLNLLVFLGPSIQPDPFTTSKVFAIDSKGVSSFLFLLAPVLLWHRKLEQRWLMYLQGADDETGHPRYDHLAHMTALIGSGWVVLWLWLEAAGWEPLTKSSLLFAFVALALPLFVVRPQIDDALLMPRLAHPGSPQVLLLGALLSILTGLMLWGQGNSISSIYAHGSGLITGQASTLQPYSTGIRLIGSLFLATPIGLLMWFVGARTRDVTHPGPVLVTTLSIVVALNLLFTVHAQSANDAVLSQTEVLVGYYFVSLTTALDRAVVIVVWSLIVLAGAIGLAKGLAWPHAPEQAHGTGIESAE